MRVSPLVTETVLAYFALLANRKRPYGRRDPQAGGARTQVGIIEEVERDMVDCVFQLGDRSPEAIMTLLKKGHARSQGGTVLQAKNLRIRQNLHYFSVSTERSKNQRNSWGVAKRDIIIRYSINDNHR